MRVVSLFSGIGGLDKGFADAGYDVVWANDFDKYAVETYKANYDNPIVCGDINSIDFDDIPDCDVLIGGFPCQPFSMMGEQRGFEDARGTLFFRIAEIIKNKTEKDLQEFDMYQNGEIYLQSLSSMLPPVILMPLEGEDVLDMAAAPGGKTTQIAALTNNNANITACEMNAMRAERLRFNVEKQGASSVYVMQKDARNIDDFFSFDRILLDAPCSGSGTLDLNNGNAFKYFSPNLVEKSRKSQIALLKKALKVLKKGKEMVYSTCSILAYENEDVVNEILKMGNAEIVPIEFTGKEVIPMLPVKIPGTICVCPNDLYEGFFVAKFKKLN